MAGFRIKGGSKSGKKRPSSFMKPGSGTKKHIDTPKTAGTRKDIKTPRTTSSYKDYKTPRTAGSHKSYETSRTAGSHKSYETSRTAISHKNTDTKRTSTKSQSKVDRNIKTTPSGSKKKAKTKLSSGTVISAIVTLLLFICAGGAAYKYINRQVIATVEIKNDVIDTQKGTINGVIIRNEEVITSIGAGEVNFIINDKERVKKGTAVLQIKNAEQAGYIEKSLEDINESLNTQQNRRSELSVFYSDALKINSQIKETVEKGIHKFIGSSTSEIYSMKESIINNINLRNQMLLTENRGSVKDFFEEKTYYENELSKHIKTIESAYSGIISYSIDNLENVFSVNEMETLTKEKVNMKPSEIINCSNKLVEEAAPVCRIVTKNEWYIASYVDNEYADGLIKDDVKKLYILNNDTYETVEMTVHYINKGENQTYIIFKSTKNIIDYMDIRNVSFKLNESAHKGLKIPNTAIVDRTFLKIPSDFIKDSTVLRQTETGYERIDVIVKSNSKGEEGYKYVLFDFSKFAIGDILISESGENNVHKILDGDIVSLKGVYKANNQTAKFFCINDENIVSAGGYSIIDPEINSALNPHDRIVVDGTNIIENQILN